MTNKADGFLKQYGMHYCGIDLMDSTQRMVEEMEKGLEGAESSLPMIPTYIGVGGQVPLGEDIIVMDAGGTNFRVATVRFSEEGSEVSNFNRYPMPGTQGRLTREEFFDAIAEYLTPVLNFSDKVGFCFSYPTEILPNRDGRLIRFAKEVRADGVEDSLIGEGINEALLRKGQPTKRFILLNDAVATMLGGIAATQDYAYEGHIGYILGTGLNTCYLESCGRIAKLSATDTSNMIINMESGCYNGIPQGRFDRELDDASAKPRDHMLEKMISGAYQGDVIYRTVCKAVEDGLFSNPVKEIMENFSTFTMWEIDQFCFRPYGGNPLAELVAGSGEDALTLYQLIDASFERAARLTAINFAAILLHTGEGKDPTRPVCVTAEGTTFYKSKLFRGKLDYYVRSFLGEELGVYVEFARAENATLIGTAVAALLN